MELRDVTSEDLMLLYHWANDEEVRRNSFSANEISLKEHTDWFKQMLQKEDVKQYILRDKGKDVGQIRIHISNDRAEISYSIAAEYRGQGYGAVVIELLKEKVRKDFPNIRKLIAEVKPQNTASRKVFLGADFVEKCSVFEMNLENDAGDAVR